MGMKIFITGIAGFLGSHLADWFINQGHYVIGCDDLSGGLVENVSSKAQLRILDITKPISTYWTMLKDVDVLYHCAAAPYEGVSVFSPAYICNNIYSGSVNIFTAAIKAGVKKIVYCSSMARYGKGKVPFTETDLPKPQDPYGISKFAAEETLKVLCEVHGVNYVIAVPHNIYGPKQYYYDPYRNVASIFANAMLQNIRPVIYGQGYQIRSFSYISDCVEPLAKMALDDNVNRQIINIGPDNNEITINELYFTLAEIIGFKKYPTYMPDRPKEVFNAYCSSDKARDMLGYETKVGIDTGLWHLVEWIKEKGPKSFNYDKIGLEIINDKTPKAWVERILK